MRDDALSPPKYNAKHRYEEAVAIIARHHPAGAPFCLCGAKLKDAQDWARHLAEALFGNDAAKRWGPDK